MVEALEESNSKYTEEKGYFFDFWEDLELLKEFTAEDFSTFSEKSKVRGMIVAVLREGIEDKYPMTNEIKKRRALTGKEILEGVNRKLKEQFKEEHVEIKKANLFFHLKKLEDLGFVEEIGYLQRGRRRTTYYGRSAKIFVSMVRDKSHMINSFENPDFVTFLQRLNPNIPINQIENTLDKVRLVNRQTSNYYNTWTRKREKDFADLELDFPEILKIAYMINTYRDDVVEGLQELALLMKLDVEKLNCSCGGKDTCTCPS
jgi:hypothetical protein